ncbi:MAG: RsmB/NOP family class I SAM-dependent RNA methyltransferase [Deltaproteobacteria bacterium]|nr:RsmB/NOP family class I SAM-dependent RNA methyltransferase [Deltaproteobacteria bacterium]
MKAARATSSKKAQKKQAVSKKASSAKKASAPKAKKNLKLVPKAGKKAEVKKTAAKEAPKKPEAKKPEAKKKVLVNAFETFIQMWKPKNESFEAGLDKLFAEYPSPDKDVEAYKRSVKDKIQTQMRKEPLTGSMEEQLGERFPRDRIHKMSSIWSMKPKSSIRLNTLKVDINGFSLSQTAKDLKIKRSIMSPWAFEVPKSEEVYTHPTYERGLYDFQDEASQLISLLVNARPGQRVLDLCAGEGDTSLALSFMMKNKGSLFVYDSDPKKTKIFKEKATRAGIDNYRILTDSQIAEVKSLDAVLIHAPSSGLGALGAHPETKWKFHKEDLPRIHRLQAALLREGARKLKLGGYLVYATSTLNKTENEMQIEHFLKSTHNSYRLVPITSFMKDFLVPYLENFLQFKWDEKTFSSLMEFDPYFVMSPDMHGTNGTFAAIIQRTRIST